MKQLCSDLENRAEELTKGIEDVSNTLAHALDGSDQLAEEDAAQVISFLADLSKLLFARIRAGSDIGHCLSEQEEQLNKVQGAAELLVSRQKE